MVPDDEKAGQILAQELMKEAIQLNKVDSDGKIGITLNLNQVYPNNSFVSILIIQSKLR